MNPLRTFLLAVLALVVFGSTEVDASHNTHEGEIVEISDTSFTLVTDYLNVCYDENTTCEIVDVIMSNNGKYALT